MRILSVVINLAAVSCLGAMPLWILGIPGTEGNYAKGWKMSFAVLYTFPAFIVALRVIGFLTRHFGQVDAEQVSRVENGTALLASLVSLGRLVQAIRTMD